MLGPKPSALPLGDTPVRLPTDSYLLTAEIIGEMRAFVKGFSDKFDKKFYWL
jgi:hypothetical protein